MTVCKKIILAVLALSVLAAFCPGVSAAFAAAVDPDAFYVSPGGTLPAAAPAGHRFTTVIDAITANEADAGGRTVYVDDGVYTGSFHIRKPVKLIGTNHAAIIQNTPEPAGSNGLWIMCSDVTIEGLTIKGYPAPAEWGAYNCINIWNIPGGVLENVTIRNNLLQPGYFHNPDRSAGYAIETLFSNDIVSRNILIEGNTIEPVDPAKGAARPFVINPGSEKVTVKNNEIKGKYVAGALVSGKKDGGVVIQGNKFHGVSPRSVEATWGWSDPLWGEVQITGNQFANWTEVPVYVEYAQINKITGNTFTDIIDGKSTTNVAIRQFLGNDTDAHFKTHIVPKEPAGTWFDNMPYVYAQEKYTKNGEHFVDYLPMTYKLVYYKDMIAADKKIGGTVSGKTFLTGAPVNEAMATKDLGAGWMDLHRPEGYHTLITYPAVEANAEDQIITVVYAENIPIPPPQTGEAPGMIPAFMFVTGGWLIVFLKMKRWGKTAKNY
ncbi:MAG: right-handed parallel beta-helix repeat-containing protein [Oscillospiraceae bacterium]|nr:right-handed parallel beta-helix repeat-containing protein [Oscillospiraceae bacterium]